LNGVRRFLWDFWEHLRRFSTFSLETLALLQIGEVTRAFLNVILSVFCCLLATWLGMILAKQF
jgi:fluoride exporter